MSINTTLFKFISFTRTNPHKNFWIFPIGTFTTSNIYNVIKKRKRTSSWKNVNKVNLLSLPFSEQIANWKLVYCAKQNRSKIFLDNCRLTKEGPTPRDSKRHILSSLFPPLVCPQEPLASLKLLPPANPWLACDTSIFAIHPPKTSPTIAAIRETRGAQAL